MAATITAIPGGDKITIGTTAEIAYTADATANGGEPLSVTIQNLHATATVTVGASNVLDEDNGHVLDAQYDAISIPLRWKNAVVYVISDTASTPVSVFVA